MTLQKEPVAWAAAITQIVESVIPVLLIFGVIAWDEAQLGAVLLAIGVITKTIAGLFTRNTVWSPESYDAAMNSSGEPDMPPA